MHVVSVLVWMQSPIPEQNSQETLYFRVMSLENTERQYISMVITWHWSCMDTFRLWWMILDPYSVCRRILFQFFVGYRSCLCPDTCSADSSLPHPNSSALNCNSTSVDTINKTAVTYYLALFFTKHLKFQDVVKTLIPKISLIVYIVGNSKILISNCMEIWL